MSNFWLTFILFYLFNFYHLKWFVNLIFLAYSLLGALVGYITLTIKYSGSSSHLNYFSLSRLLVGLIKKQPTLGDCVVCLVNISFRYTIILCCISCQYFFSLYFILYCKWQLLLETVLYVLSIFLFVILLYYYIVLYLLSIFLFVILYIIL
jgi:hypothetical protein